MKTIKCLLPILMFLPLLINAQTATAGDTDTDAKVVKMTGTDQMRFTVTNIEASPGQKIKVILTTVSDYPKIAMAHNFLLLKAKADATALANAAARASKNEYIPEDKKDQILACTGLAGDGETVEVTFTAPKTPGEYLYICSFPGHYAAGMKGTLTVTNDKNPPAKVVDSENPKGKSESTGLTQRTGIPFEIRQAEEDTHPLLGIMINLEQNMAVVQAGIWRGDFQIISEAANALVNHAKIPKREIEKIRTVLGEEGLKNFVAADKYWHSKAKELSQAADEEKMEPIVNLTAELIQRCASCHVKYRAPLRDSPKWLER